MVAGERSPRFGGSRATAVENFRCFCTGEKGVSKSSGKPLHFKGVAFHRIITGFMCQVWMKPSLASFAVLPTVQLLG